MKNNKTVNDKELNNVNGGIKIDIPDYKNNKLMNFLREYAKKTIEKFRKK